MGNSLAETNQSFSSAELSHVTSVLGPELRSITLSTLTAISLAAFDGLGITVAGNKISGSLGDVDLLPWVFTAFALTLSVASLAAGSLIDGWGLRRTYRATLVLFLVASLACTVAPSMKLLIVARLFQGVGGGMIMAVALAAIGISVPPHLRSRAFAANSLIWGVMSFAGPAVAALLLKSSLGWRSVFAVNIPLTLFAAVIGWNRLPGPREDAKVHFDVRGLALIGGVTTVLLLGVSNYGRWTIPSVGLAIALGAVAWRHLGRATDPAMDQRYLTTMPIGGINIAVFVLFLGGISVESFVPLFVVAGLGGSEWQGAFSVTFLAFGWTCASIIASRLLDRVHETTVIVGGIIISIPPLLLGALTYSTSTPIWLVALISLCQGLGIGATTNAGLTLLQKISPADEMGRTTSSHYFVRNVGGVVGIATAGGVLLGIAGRRIGNLDALRPLLRGEKVTNIDPSLRAAIANGYRWSNALALVCGCVALVISIRVARSVNPTRSRFRSAAQPHQ
jgi:MFS family permease